MICTFLESVLCDIVLPEVVLSFLPSSKMDEYYCQQLLMHKQSLTKFWNNLVPCPSKIKKRTKKVVNTSFVAFIWIHFSNFTTMNTAQLLLQQNASMPRHAHGFVVSDSFDCWIYMFFCLFVFLRSLQQLPDPNATSVHINSLLYFLLSLLLICIPLPVKCFTMLTP